MVKGIILLFTLNLADALLTLFWVKNGFASEGNHLMARLLEINDLAFLSVKIGIGLVAAVVLYRFAHLKLAKYGLTLALTIYIGLMGIHFVTGLSAAGIVSEHTIAAFVRWSSSLLPAFG